MPPITCHILDTTRGKPAADVTCALYCLNSNPNFVTNDSLDTAIDVTDDLEEKVPFAVAKTNSDGRIPEWIINKKYARLAEVGISSKYIWDNLKPGVYKIRFHTKQYFIANASASFFPYIDINFIVNDPPEKHYHIPLLLSNHSYTTYRGS